MAAEPTCQFPLRIEAVEGDLGGAEAVEQFALELRAELADLPVTRIDQLSAGEPPEGARAVEIVAAVEFLMTAVQAAGALPDVIKVIRQVAARFARRRQPVRLTVAGHTIDPVRSSDAELSQVVDTLLALPAQPAVGARRALVVANSRYDDPRLARLRSPGHDADALARVLGDPGIGGFSVERLVDADERTIRRQIAALFTDSDRDDVLLLHFSCHGVKDARGRLFLAARDTDLSVLGATAIPASLVNDLLSEAQSRRVVLILDCCYSGAFARGGAAVRAGSEVQIADEFGAGSGRIVLTASSATEYAFEGGELTQDEGRPSAFTGALVRGLESGEADLDADGEISIDELYDYTYRTVREHTPGQAPMKWSFGVEGSLVVARSVRPAALPQPIADDLASDRVVLRLEAVRALEAILRSGKAGHRAAALATLARIRDHDDSLRVQRTAAAALTAAGVVPAGPIAKSPATPTVSPQPSPPQASPPQPSPPPSKPAPSPEPAAQPAPPPPQPAAQPVTSPPQPSPPEADQPPAEEARQSAGWVKPGRGNLVALAAGLLALLGLLLYTIGAAEAGVHWWTFSWTWVAELVVLVLLLYSRQTSWLGLLAGLLSWEWLYSSVIGDGDTNIRYGSTAFGFANFVSLASLVLAVTAILRRRSEFGRIPGARRLTVAAVLAVLSLAASLVTSAVVWEAVDLHGDVDRAAVLIGAVLCAATMPLISTVAPASGTAWMTAVGWLIGGSALALPAADELPSYYQATAQAWMWPLLLAAAAVAVAVNTVPRLRTANAATRGSPAPAGSGPSSSTPAPSFDTPPRLGNLRAAVAAGALLSVLLYFMSDSDRIDLFDRLAWPSQHAVARAAAALAAVLLLATRQTRWLGLLIGVLSWEWMYSAHLWTTRLPDNLDRGWVLLIASADLIALAALAGAVVMLVHQQADTRDGGRRRAVEVAGIAALSIVTCLMVAHLIYTLIPIYHDKTALVAMPLAACLCSIPAPLLYWRGPASPVLHYVALGWLIGGAQFALTETHIMQEFEKHWPELAATWLLLLITAVTTVAFAARHHRPTILTQHLMSVLRWQDDQRTT